MSSPQPPPLPTLSTHPTTSPTTQTSALNLIADSIAQQRQSASRALLTHPISLALLILVLALLAQLVDSNITLLPTAGGVVMLLLVGVRAWTGGYLVRAEGVGWVWLREGEKGKGKKVGEVVEGGGEEGEEGEGKEGEDDREREENVVVVTVWDEQVIATAVLRVVRRPDRRAWVRAWTTKLKYRGTGVGRGVLEEAVRVAVGEYGCTRVEFAEDHANSTHLLPSIFNRGFLRQEARARKLLAGIMEGEMTGGRKGKEKEEEEGEGEGEER